MIDAGQAFAYFDKNHGPLKPSTNGWFEGVCPYCDDPKLAVNFTYNQVKCWKCFDKMFIIDFIEKYEDVRRFEAYEVLESYESVPVDYTYIERNNTEVSTISLPKGYQSLLRGKGALGDRARNYLMGRGFDLNYLDKIGVGYCNEHDEEDDYFGYIIVPLKKNGKLVYFIGRNFIDNDLRYKNPPRAKFGVGKSEVLFNEEALYTQERIFLTEGWSDAISLGVEGVSMQGLDLSLLQTSIIINSSVEEVVIVLDVGQYKKALKQALKLFNFKRIKVLKLDLLKQHGKDVNEIGKERILELSRITNYMGFNTLYKQLRSS